MAEKIEGHNFSPPRSKYPWHDWTDGSQWAIYHGSDYTISTYNMQISLHGRARAEGIRVKSNTFKESKHDERGVLQVVEGLKFEFYE